MATTIKVVLFAFVLAAIIAISSHSPRHQQEPNATPTVEVVTTNEIARPSPARPSHRPVPVPRPRPVAPAVVDTPVYQPPWCIIPFTFPAGCRVYDPNGPV